MGRSVCRRRLSLMVSKASLTTSSLSQSARKDEEELYVCIQSHREYDEIFFYHEGGVDVGDVDAKAQRIQIPVEEAIDAAAVVGTLCKEIPDAKKAKVAEFITKLYEKVFLPAHFVYLEINPVVMTETQIVPLDCAAKIDLISSLCSGLLTIGP